MSKIIAIDLFSGAGGTTCGLRKSGIEVKLAVEIDAVAVSTYKLNNKDVNVIEDDITNVNKEVILNTIKIKDEEKLLLVACPPCQGFSTIGSNNKNDKRNFLIFEYLRLIKELNPAFLLMENVAGMIRKKNQKIFLDFISEIENDYYFIYDILNTADYGVPQLRKRLVLHGVKKSSVKNNEFIDLPAPTHSKLGKEEGKLPWVNADIIMDLPSIEAGEEYIGGKIYNHISNNLSELNIKRINYIRMNGGSRKSLPYNLQLECHKNKNGHSDVYGILDINRPAITITGGCMSYSKGRFGHPTQNRALSAREAARLQSFDDDYVFLGNKGELAKQIGNAVPVKLAEASGKYFINLLNKMERNG